MEPDTCDSYDSDTEDSLYSEYGIGACNFIDVYRYCSSDIHSVYRIWTFAGLSCASDSIFRLFDTLYFIVYGAGYQFEKSICKALWRTFIEQKGAGRHELDTDFFLKLFGVTELFGISLGFWIAMGICLLVVVGMNLVFWGMKPADQTKRQGK